MTLERIADPDVPDGCLIAQTAMTTPVLNAAIAARASEALGHQRARLRTALSRTRLAASDVEDFAVHFAALNQSLTVMSRAGTSQAELRTVTEISVNALAQALRCR